MKLTWTVCRREALDPDTIAAMVRIHDALYAGVDAATFREDLAEKDEIVLVRDDAGQVRGYTTLRVYEDEGGWVLFSGDTGVDRAAWGSTALQTGWLAAALAAYERHGPVDWLLLAGGPRTYRYLPVFFEAFWPSPFAETPPDVAARMDRLAARRYGLRYFDGIVQLGAGGLRPEHDLPRPGDAVDAWFRSRNPGFAQGDELVCLCRIAPENLTRAGQRTLARVRAR